MVMAIVALLVVFMVMTMVMVIVVAMVVLMAMTRIAMMIILGHDGSPRLVNLVCTSKRIVGDNHCYRG